MTTTQGSERGQEKDHIVETQREDMSPVFDKSGESGDRLKFFLVGGAAALAVIAAGFMAGRGSVESAPQEQTAPADGEGIAPVEIPEEEPSTQPEVSNIITDTSGDPLLEDIILTVEDRQFSKDQAIFSPEPLGKYEVNGPEAKTVEEKIQAAENNRALAFSNFYGEADPRYLDYYFADQSSEEYLLNLAAIVKIQQGVYEPREFYAYVELLSSEETSSNTIRATYNIRYVPGGDGVDTQAEIQSPTTVVMEKVTKEFTETDEGLRAVSSE